MWDFECPVCKNDGCVPAGGPKKSSVLIVGDQPGEQEVLKGQPFTGPTGGVLRAELARLHLDLSSMRLCNLWLHPHAAKFDPKCLEYSANKVLEEARGKRVILLLGSEPVKYFCSSSVEGYNGLILDSPWFADAVVLACVQPAIVFHSGLGELRFALSRFAAVLEKEKV